MSGATKLQSATKQVHEPPRAILGPTGNRARVFEARRKIEVLSKSQQKPKKPVEKMSQAAVKNNLSVDSTCFSDSSSSSSGVSSSSGKNVKHYGIKKVEDVRNGREINDVSSKKERPVKRCDWITPNSDPLYMSFHDEEWGVPVYDDRKLFELLVYSQALAELSWPAILHMRDIFWKLFDNFDPSSIAQFTEKKLLSLRFNGNLLLSEPKLRAVVENAKQMLKIQQEFGSFSNYCWRFVNHKPLRNGFRYARQVPVKTPKAELISKDLMRRGFRCVGPTAVYSFMQVAGFVNDHLKACFRYQECNVDVKKDFKPKSEETEIVTKALGKTCVSHD
ncbi:PREDICTED: uncharacterized protein LOC105120690 isoform X2 [Populus euphratica]|uniref:Uncharacterized protein LOC105120690 isoform X2 n=1 Tax=Populus euphratica TaxID=75702 RepID=A0AAJ6TUQ0_POPEU|nr:PREDICTED: uncharacterized protein LOC105120690 isoform X2 [Populus euphratica]